MNKFDFIDGSLNPFLVYASYDEFGKRVNDLFVSVFGHEGSIDVFEYPEIVTERGLPKLNRLPALVYINRREKDLNSPNRWCVYDIPSQVYNEVLKYHSVKNG